MSDLNGNDPDAARQAAKDILSSRRYRDVRTRRPFERQLDWIGKRIDRFFRWLGRFFDAAVPGSELVGWLVFGAVVVVAVAWLTRHYGVRRRARVEVAEEAAAVDWAALEREAAAAEQAGDHRRAVELRFRAGVARLDHATSVTASRQTNGALARVLATPFASLGAVFDRVHYGQGGAGPDDSAQARSAWPSIVDAAKSAEAPGRGRRRRRARKRAAS